MSMLAEPRSRQKWSQDPRNTNWSRDKTRFGYQMLTKMGWNEGRGLGQNLNGNVNHLKVNKIGGNAGVGRKKSHDDNWIAHQDDFNALLSSLNQGSSDSKPGKMSSLENRVKSSKKKILYKRFIKSKDLSNASSHDLACIFGQRNKSAENTLLVSDDECKSDSSESCPIEGEIYTPKDISIKTVDSGLSITDYFSKKMEALKQKKTEKENTINSETVSIVNDLDECCPIEKKKKKKKNNCNDVPLIPKCIETDTNERKRKKDTDHLVLENGLVKKKKKKKTENLHLDVELVDNCYEQIEVIKKKKKKKKKKQDVELAEVEP